MSKNNTVIKFPKEAFVPVYYPVLKIKKSIFVFYGGRGSAKTTFALQKKLIRNLTLPYNKCLLARKIRGSIRESLFEDLVSLIRGYKIESFFKIKESEMKIVNKINGNSFIPIGLKASSNRSGNAKGIVNPTDIILDEADESTEEEFQDLILSLRGAEDKETILIFNPPKTKKHWLLNFFFPKNQKGELDLSFENPEGTHFKVNETEEFIVFHTCYKMNNKAKSYYKLMNLLKEKNYEKYKNKGLGLISAPLRENLALPSFSDSNIKEVYYNDAKRIIIGFDFNKLPYHTVLVCQAFYNSSGKFAINQIKEFCLKGKSLKETLRAVSLYIKGLNYRDKIRLFYDYTGRTSKDLDSTSFVSQIKRYFNKEGFNILDNSKVNPSVRNSLNFLDDVLDGLIHLQGGEEVELCVSPSCSISIYDYENTKTNEEGGLLKTVVAERVNIGGVETKVSYQKFGHNIDVLRYIITGVLEQEYKKYLRE